jgi:LysR family transcriptional regulator, carnitine catabolism transcriptional activator
MIYPSIAQLRAFAAVAEQGSFRKAANQLVISQPALSNQIRDLERAVRMSLFHRTTRSVRLTEEGEQFLVRVRCALGELESGLHEMQGQVVIRGGRVIVACLPPVACCVLPRVIASFARNHPGVEIQVLDEYEVPLVQRVLEREADFGLGPEPGANDDLSYRKIFEDSFVAVVPCDHAIAAHPTVRLRDLANYPLLTVPPGAYMRTYLERVFDEHSLVLNPAFDANHPSTLCGLVEAGLGVAILPKMVLQMMGNTALQTCEIVEPRLPRQIGIIQRRDQVFTPSAAIFLDTVRNTFGTTDGDPLKLGSDVRNSFSYAGR